MKKRTLQVTLGQDLSAYATLEIPADSDLSDANLIRIAQTAVEQDDFVFDEDWETTCALRIVSVQDRQGHYLKEDIPVEDSPYDAGQVLQSFLKGHVSFANLIEAAAQARLIDPLEIIHCTGILKIPGAAPISADFSCRQGATQAEKDLAFMEALLNQVEVQYVNA